MEDAAAQGPWEFSLCKDSSFDPPRFIYTVWNSETGEKYTGVDEDPRLAARKATELGRLAQEKRSIG